MPKNASKAEVNNFIGGLVTEASELAFPPNASPDIVNYEMNRDGSIQRRLGMDLEPSGVLFSPPAPDNGLSPPYPKVFKWNNVAGNADKSFLVLQFDNALKFFDLSESALSFKGVVGEITLTNFPKDVKYGMGAIDGKLVIAAGIETIAVVTYNGTSFAAEYSVLRTRDLWGLEVPNTGGVNPYETDALFRGTERIENHFYNLRNQSWGSAKAGQTGGRGDPLIMYRNHNGVYPSNSEQVWVGMQYRPDESNNNYPTERFYAGMASDLYGTASQAAKGYFIIDVVNRGASRKQALEDNRVRNLGQIYASWEDPPIDYTTGGATLAVEFAGRMFFGGFTGELVGGDSRSPNLSTYIFFSQLIKSSKDIFKCYQQGDPTSRDDSDLLETDGGFIRISGVEKVVGMVPIGPSLIVIGTNGVWSITGGSDFGFSATNYRVDKISTFGCISASSIVEEKGNVFFWSEEGIYVYSKNQLGDGVVESITRGRIDTFYQNIPLEARSNSIGINDIYTGKIRWLYEVENGITEELILDTILGIFYPFKIESPNPNLRVVGLFQTNPFNRLEEDGEVISLTEVVLSGTDPVVVPDAQYEASYSSIKYLVKVDNTYSFAYYRNTKYRDFERIDGVGIDAQARGVTGAITGGDSSIRKQVQFLTMHFRQKALSVGDTLTNDSSCLMQVKWDWAISADAKKWSALKQAYRNPKPRNVTNFDVVSTRNMLRGQGRTMSLYFQTEPYKDCHIIGWNLAIDGNSKI